MVTKAVRDITEGGLVYSRGYEVHEAIKLTPEVISRTAEVR